jgi:hypothetical protein
MEELERKINHRQKQKELNRIYTEQLMAKQAREQKLFKDKQEYEINLIKKSELEMEKRAQKDRENLLR